MNDYVYSLISLFVSWFVLFLINYLIYGDDTTRSISTAGICAFAVSAILLYQRRQKTKTRFDGMLQMAKRDLAAKSDSQR